MDKIGDCAAKRLYMHVACGKISRTHSFRAVSAGLPDPRARGQYRAHKNAKFPVRGAVSPG